MPEWAVTIIVALITAIFSGGLFSIILYKIQQKDKKNDTLAQLNNSLAQINKELKLNKKDLVRLQLIVMIANFPDDEHEIMTIAENYFNVLKGNWYATSFFKSWLKDRDLETPMWFNDIQEKALK